jgi:hypothetical protein
MPVTARCTFAKVNSSAMTARHPEVPNLIGIAIGGTFLEEQMVISLRCRRLATPQRSNSNFI